MSSLYNPNLLYPAKLNANFEIMNVQLFFFSGFFGRFTIGVTLASILNFVPNIPLEENSNQKLVQIRKTIEYRLSRTTRSRFQFSIDPRPTLSRVFQRGKILIIGKERFGEEDEPLSLKRAKPPRPKFGEEVIKTVSHIITGQCSAKTRLFTRFSSRFAFASF